MGSHSDWELMSHTSATLDALGIPHEVNAISAHRAPDRLAEYCGTARDRGLKVLIAGAGLAAAILALGDERIRSALDAHRAKQTAKALEKTDPRTS